MTTTRPQRLLIDVSLIQGSNCHRAFNYTHNHGFTQRDYTYKMEYGTAGHAYLKNKYLNELPDRSNAEQVHLEGTVEAFKHYTKFDVPEDDFRTPDHLLSTLAHFHAFDMERLPLQIAEYNGQKAVELIFAWPYGKFGDIEVILCGTIDVVFMLQGRVALMDHKFTAQWSHQKFFKGFNLKPQPAFYSMMLKKIMGLDYYPSAVIQAFFIRKPLKTNPLATCEIITSDPIEYTPAQMRHYKDYFNWKIQQLIEAQQTGIFTPNFSACEQVYGPCPYANACQLEFEEDRIEYMEAKMNKRIYDPRTWSET